MYWCKYTLFSRLHFAYEAPCQRSSLSGEIVAI